MLMGCGCGAKALTGMRGGLGMTPGYSVDGGCDASGNLTGGTATGAFVTYPDGSQHCLQYSSQAWINLNYNRQLIDPPSGTYTVPVQQAPILGIPPIANDGPGPIYDGAPITAPSNIAASVGAVPVNDVMLGSFDVSAFVKDHWVWLAAGAGVAVVLAMTR